MVVKHEQFSDDNTVYAWWEVDKGFFMPITGKWLREFSFLKLVWDVLKVLFICIFAFCAFMFCLIWFTGSWDEAVDTSVSFATGLWEVAKAFWGIIRTICGLIYDKQFDK